MQGGDFVYGPAGTQKDNQQNKTLEKGAKKSDFKLSKILPSPTKNCASHTLKGYNTTLPKAQTDAADTIKNEINVEEKDDDTEEKRETDEETTSDGDWYV